MPILLLTVQAFALLPLGGKLPAGLHDPDTWLRLSLVRDWLQGGSWYDHRYASNAPFDPIVSPWTRPLDLVIALLVKLQFFDTDLNTKLVRAALVMPLMWMTGIALALASIIRRITPMPHATVMLGVLLISAPINYNYLNPGNGDHHGPLGMLFCWVVALLMQYDARRGRGLTAIGALLALMLWISPEALFLIAIVYGWLGLRWLAGEPMRPLAVVATVTALLAAVAVAVERPPSQWAVPLYDSISIALVGPLALVALAAWLLARLTSFFWLWRALAAALLLAIVAAIIHGLDPLFFHGPMVQAHAYIRTDFLPHIHEAQPAFSEPWLKLVGLLIQPAAALYVAGRCATRRHGVLAPAQAMLLLYVLVGALALYMIQMRWAYYFFPLVPLVLAPFLGAWLNPHHRKIDSFWPASRLRRFTTRQLVARRVPLLLALLVLPSLCIVGSALMEKRATTDFSACPAAIRTLLQNGEIDAIGGGRALTVFAPSDLSSEFLFFTRHRPIASHYHREGAGIQTLWQAQLSTNMDALAQVLRARKADLLILCPDGTIPDDAAVHRLYQGKAKPPANFQPYTIRTNPPPKSPPAIFLVKQASR